MPAEGSPTSHQPLPPAPAEKISWPHTFRQPCSVISRSMSNEPKANSFRSAVLSGAVGRHDALVANKKSRGDRTSDGLTGITVPREETRSHNQRGGDRHRLTGERAT